MCFIHNNKCLSYSSSQKFQPNHSFLLHHSKILFFLNFPPNTHPNIPERHHFHLNLKNSHAQICHFSSSPPFLLYTQKRWKIGRKAHKRASTHKNCVFFIYFYLLSPERTFSHLFFLFLCVFVPLCSSVCSSWWI